MYEVYNLNDIYVFSTDDFNVAKKEVEKYGGTIKDKDEKVLFEISEFDKEYEGEYKW